MLKVTHNAGFFSCCSIRLEQIIYFFNNYKKLPTIVDSSEQFSLYKNSDDTDITFDYFKDYNDIDEIINYETYISYIWKVQFSSYKEIDYVKICPFIRKYFTPSDIILNIIKKIETKYEINDYSNICALFYRGNDKIRETELCDYTLILDKAREILLTNPNIKFLIQSDETEYMELMLKEFPENSFYFKDEIRHINKQDSTVDVIFKENNNEFSKYYLGITVIMSKCKYVICGSSGNCSAWIAQYRGNADNVYQFVNGIIK